MSKADFRTMICIHNDEGKAKAEANAKRFFELANSRVSEGYTVDYSNMLTYVVSSLWWDWEVEMDSMPTDMWSAVITQHHRYVEDAKDDEDAFVVDYKARVECDRLEDGVIATWLHYYDLKQLDES